MVRDFPGFTDSVSGSRFSGSHEKIRSEIDNTV